jgi:two-component system chemotaxis response regulator CheY
VTIVKNVILVVDDSATIRKFVATSLQLWGYQVVTASDGMEAFERMPSQSIDLIITDLNMPDMDGFEFMINLRLTPAYATIPVIVLSSITNQKEKQYALELGAFSYLEKPFSAETLHNEVRRFFSDDSRQDAATTEIGNSSQTH